MPTMYQTSGIIWHLTGIEVFWSSWQLFSIVTTTAIVTMLLPSNCICIVQWQHLCWYLYVPDTAEEVCDWCFVEVAVKQIGSHGDVADTLPRGTYLHQQTHPHSGIIHSDPAKNNTKFCAHCAGFSGPPYMVLTDISRLCQCQGVLVCCATYL